MTSEVFLAPGPLYLRLQETAEPLRPGFHQLSANAPCHAIAAVHGCSWLETLGTSEHYSVVHMEIYTPAMESPV